MDIRESKLYKLGIALLVAYVFVGGICRAAAKPFWADEIITIGLAKLPSSIAVWDAQVPPMLYLLERVSAHLPFDERIAYRLPSILAFCCMVLCVALFVRKTGGGKFAAVCAAILLTSIFWNWYGVEARGYALMAGFTALAMICYQRAEGVLGCVLMAVSLAAADASHFYAVFALIPFGLAELAYFLTVRRVRLGIWAALVGGTLPFLVLWPLLLTFRRIYGLHYTGTLSFDEMLRAYGWMFNLPYTVGLGIAAAALAAVVIYAFGFLRDSVAGIVNQTPVHEGVLVLGFLFLPPVMYLVIRVMHGGFSPRYLLLTTLSIPVAVSYVLPTLDKRALAVFLFFFFGMLAVQEAVFWRYYLSVQRHNTSPGQGIEQFIDSAGHNDLPLLVSNPNNYLELVYYSSPRARSRLVSVVDPSAAIAYAGSDTPDIEFAKLRPYLNLQVYDFADFGAKHPEFLVYSDGNARWDWWPKRLLHDGYSLELVAMDQPTRIYLVRNKH
jgi:hypothetical protein